MIGASCSTADGTLNIYADVTLLATGGYGASVALRPADQMGTLFYGASSSTGDGIIMAEEVGAMTHYMQYLKSYPQGIEKPLDGGNITADGTTFRSNAYISPLASQAVTLNDGAIYVNVEGERCMNENMDFVSIKKVTQKQTDMTVYLVMDQKGYDKWMGMMEVSAGLTPEIVAPWLDADDGKPVFRKGATVEEAAAKAGIDAEKLSATVAHFNEMVASGKDDDFGRAEMSVIRMARSTSSSSVCAWRLLWAVSRRALLLRFMTRTNRRSTDSMRAAKSSAACMATSPCRPTVWRGP